MIICPIDIVIRSINLSVYRVLMTDASDNVVNSLKYYGEYGPDGAHMPLNYELTRTNESCHTACVWKLADDFLYGVPTYAVANWMVS